MQLHPVRLLPVTADACALQLAAVVHWTTHAGYSSRPSTHAPQSRLALYGHGHSSHVAPRHLLRHVQLQPTSWSPEMDAAWPLQCVALSQASAQRGKLTRPLTQLAQSLLAL